MKMRIIFFSYFLFIVMFLLPSLYSSCRVHQRFPFQISGKKLCDNTSPHCSCSLKTLQKANLTAIEQTTMQWRTAAGFLNTVFALTWNNLYKLEIFNPFDSLISQMCLYLRDQLHILKSLTHNRYIDECIEFLFVHNQRHLTYSSG